MRKVVVDLLNYFLFCLIHTVSHYNKILKQQIGTIFLQQILYGNEFLMDKKVISVVGLV